MSKCLVTGGCGFIGSNLVDHLIELGNDVHVIDDLSAASNDEFYFNDSASYYKLSISHRVGVEKVFLIFHLFCIRSQKPNPVE